jgi:hypothetical protein
MKGNTGCDCIDLVLKRQAAVSRTLNSVKGRGGAKIAVFGTAQARMNSTYKEHLERGKRYRIKRLSAYGGCLGDHRR